MKPKAIVLFGPPYAGKGTVGKKFCAMHPEYVYLATGDLVRQELKTNSILAKTIISYISHGRFIPDEIICKMFENAILDLCNRGVFDVSKNVLLVDGIPRKPEQAEWLCGILDVICVLHFMNLPNLELVQRRNKRVEDMVAQGLQPRIDDNLEACMNRIKEYYTDTYPTLDAFHSRRIPILGLDGLGSVETVMKRMLGMKKEIEKKIKK